MKTKKFVGIVVASLLALVIALLVSVCLVAIKDHDQSPLGTPKMPGAVQSSSAGLLAAYSLEEMVADAELIVLGTVGDRTDSLLIQPVLEASDPMYYTDHFIEVDQVLYGDQQRAQTTIALRTSGGSGEQFQSTSIDEAKLKSGEQYLLFLYKLYDGRGYNTEGDHFYICGVNQGCFQTDADGSYRGKVSLDPERATSMQGLETFTKDSGEPYVLVTPDAIKSLASTLAEKESPQEKKTREIADLNSEYEKGDMRQEVYDIEMRELTEYARVLSADEVKRYEEKVQEDYRQIQR